MYPSAVIFDFDGVIVDTEPIHYKVFQEILNPLGLGYSWEEYTTTYMGYDDRDAFKAAFETQRRTLDEATLHNLINKKAQIFEHVVTQGVTPYTGVIQLVRELNEHKIPLAICSGALRSDIIPILEQFSIRDLFSHIVTADDVPQSKPHPASYIQAKRLVLQSFPALEQKQNCIYVIEDTPAGIQSAKGAGLTVIAVTNSYTIDKLASADYCITSLSELTGGNWPLLSK